MNSAPVVTVIHVGKVAKYFLTLYGNVFSLFSVVPIIILPKVDLAYWNKVCTFIWTEYLVL